MRYFLFLLVTAFATFSQPCSAQEREWILDAQDEDAFLLFGVPETDDVGVSFWCKLGSRKVKMYFPEGSPQPAAGREATFHLSIGGRDFPMTGTTTANELVGATSIETERSIDDPVFKALLDADRFTMKLFDHATTYPLSDADLGQLLHLCGNAP